MMGTPKPKRTSIPTAIRIFPRCPAQPEEPFGLSVWFKESSIRPASPGSSVRYEIQRERKPENDETVGQRLPGAIVEIVQMVEEVKAGNPAVCQASGPGSLTPGP